MEAGCTKHYTFAEICRGLHCSRFEFEYVFIEICAHMNMQFTKSAQWLHRYIFVNTWKLAARCTKHCTFAEICRGLHCSRFWFEHVFIDICAHMNMQNHEVCMIVALDTLFRKYLSARCTKHYTFAEICRGLHCSRFWFEHVFIDICAHMNMQNHDVCMIVALDTLFPILVSSMHKTLHFCWDLSGFALLSILIWACFHRHLCTHEYAKSRCLHDRCSWYIVS